MILVLMIVVSGSLLVSHALALRKGQRRPKGEMPEDWGTLGLAMGSFMLYAVGIQFLGFLIATPMYMAVFMTVLGLRRWGLLVVGSIAVTLAFYLLFVQVMFVPLPKGVGLFRTISRLFY
jgi:hypothetical protein